jgi:LysM repeat protein
VFCLLFMQQLSAQTTTYLQIDPSCMDRLEYHINGQTTGVEYIAYRVRLNNNEYVTLELGAEASNSSLSAPENLRSCRNLNFNKEFVDRLNTGENAMYIVRKSDFGYNISPIYMASYTRFEGSYVEYSSFNYDFKNQLENTISGINLSSDEAPSHLYYSGNDYIQCIKSYDFRLNSKEVCRPPVDITFVPQIGVIRERTGLSYQNNTESTLNLVRINDVSLDTYINSICEKTAQPSMSNTYAEGLENNHSNEGTVTTYSSESDSEVMSAPMVIIDGQVTDENDNQSNIENVKIVSSKSKPTKVKPAAIATSKTTTKFKTDVKAMKEEAGMVVTAVDTKDVLTEKSGEIIKCKDTTVKGAHIVQQGETLYGIARKSGITVEQIRSWNSLNDKAVLKPCMRLATVAPVSLLKVKPVIKDDKTEVTTKKTKIAVIEVPKPKVTPAKIAVDKVRKKGEVETDEEVVTISKPAVETTTSTAAWKTNNTGVHKVKQGETLSGIAKLYGYTTERFMAVNNMKAGDILKVGQLLIINDCVCPAGEKMATKNEVSKFSVVPQSIAITTTETFTSKGEDERVVLATTSVKKLHIVEEGETIASVAKKYKMSNEQLCKLNQLDKNEILVTYQKLVVE